MNKQSIKIFYHILAVNNYKDIISYQLSDIKESGLFDKVEKIFLIVIYKKEEDLQYIKNLCKDQLKLEILHYRKFGDPPIILHKDSIFKCEIEMAEGEGIFKMLDHAKLTSEKSSNDIYMFIHTKGVCDPPYHKRPSVGCLIEDYENLSRSDLRKKVLENMQKGVTSQWKNHIDKLNKGHFFYAYIWNFFWIRQDFLLNHDDKSFTRISNNPKDINSSEIKDRHWTSFYCSRLLLSMCYDTKNKPSINSNFYKNHPHLNNANLFKFSGSNFHFLPQLYKGDSVHSHKIGIYV